MKCQILFSGKNKKNILKCRLLQILPRVLSVNYTHNEEQAVWSKSFQPFMTETNVTNNFYRGFAAHHENIPI